MIGIEMDAAIQRMLSIDAGQSGCRVRLIDVAGAGRDAQTPGLPVGVPTGDALAQTLSPAVDLLLSGKGDGDRVASADHTAGGVHTVAVGVTGVHGRPVGARSLLDAWGPRYGVRVVVVADDCVTGYLGALGAKPGVVIAAGTGAVAVATDAKTVCARTDGLGQILGDAGSGFWVGRRGLEEAFRCADGRGGSEALLQRAAHRYGDLPGLPGLLSSSPHRGGLVASFAVDVADAARTGDSTARAIWIEAGRLLAESVVAALRRVGLGEEPTTVSWAGALFSAGELLLAPFTKAVRAAAPRAVVRPPSGEPLDGAELLGRCPRLPGFDDLVDVASQEDSE